MHPSTLALEVLAAAAENADPASHGPDPGLDDTPPIADFGAQHPDHEPDARRHNEDVISGHDNAASLFDADDEEVVDDIAVIEGAAVIEPHPNPLPVAAEVQDPGNQVSDNESAGDDITIETVDPAKAVSLQDSQSTVDVPWAEDSLAVIDDSDGLAEEQLKENDGVFSLNDTSAAIDTGEPQPVQSQHYNLRPAWARSYSHRLASNMNAATGTKSYDLHVQLLQFVSNNMETCPGDMFSYIFGFMMTQMTASQGIWKHGQRAVDALFSEFCQLDDKTVFDPIDASMLTHEQKKLP